MIDMSLDLYIKSQKPVQKRGTGVYVRKDGATMELKTLAEVVAFFPDADVSRIQEIIYETDEVWHENITHNMVKMAHHVPIGKLTLFDYLWEPGEHGFDKVSEVYTQGISTGVSYLKNHKEELLPFEPPVDPETGKRWGNYDLLVSFCTSLFKCLSELDLSEAYEIVSSV